MTDQNDLNQDDEDIMTPAEEGEHSVSGSTPSTSSDDNVE